MFGRYSTEGPRKWYLYYALCDETYAMLSKDDTPEGVNLSGYRLLVTLFDQLSWLVGCVLGGCVGTLLNFNSTGIDFAMVALFTTVFLQQWIDTKNHIPAITGLLATFVCRLIFGSDFFLIPAMIIIVITMTVMRRRIEKGEETGQPTGGDDYA